MLRNYMLIDIGSITNVNFRLQTSIRFWEKYQTWCKDHGESSGLITDTHILQLTYTIPSEKNKAYTTDIPTRIIDARDIQELVYKFGCVFL